MPHMTRNARAAAVVLTASLLALTTRAHSEQLNSRQIMDRLAAWLEAQDRGGPRHALRRVSHVQKLDDEGKVESEEILVYETTRIDGREYERLVTKNGAPLQGDDLRKEEERERTSRGAAQGRQPDDNSVTLDKSLMDRFRFELVGSETIAGRPTWVLRFFADASKTLPDERAADAALNALQGRIWVDAEEAALVRIEAALAHTVRIGLGVLAMLKKATFRLDLRRNESGVWLPRSMDSYLWGRTLLFKPIRQREYSVYSDLGHP
jgi:hypothetical protein